MHRAIVVTIAVTVMFLASSHGVAAFECRDYEGGLRPVGVVAHSQEEASRLLVAGDIAYAISPAQASMSIFDLSDIQQPVALGQLPLPAGASGLAADQDDLLVTVPGHGLYRFDRSDPRDPTLVDSLDLGLDMLDVALGDGVAFVALGGAGVRAIGLEIPGGMVGLGALALPSAVQALAYGEGWLYLATFGHGLQIVQTSDPTSLQLAGGAGLAASAETIALGHGLVVMGASVTVNDKVIAAFDIGVPFAPQLAGLAEITVSNTGAPRPVPSAPDRIYAAVPRTGLFELHLGGGALVASAFRGGSDRDFHVESERYVSLDETTLVTGTPGSLFPAPPVTATGASTRAIHADGLLYTIRDRQLRILDLADPAAPQVLVHEILDEADAGHPDLALLGETLYVEGRGDAVVVVDVTDPTQPAVVGEIVASAFVAGLLVDDDVLYVISSGGHLHTYDLTDPWQPQPLGMLDIDATGARAMIKVGDELLAACRATGVRVVDVIDPAQPLLRTDIVAGPVRSLASRDDRLFVADGDDPLEVWRRDPDAGDWTQVAAGPVSDLQRIVVNGSLGYALRTGGQLTILDLASGTIPTDLGGFEAGPVYGSYGLLAGDTWISVSQEADFRFWAPGCPADLTGTPDRAPTAAMSLMAAPNPFNPTTRISFELERAATVRLQVFDLRGRLVDTLIDDPLAAGPHARDWRGRDARGRALPSGIYLAQLSVGDRAISRKLTLLE